MQTLGRVAFHIVKYCFVLGFTLKGLRVRVYPRILTMVTMVTNTMP